jgi:restriction endonuclease S subunit
MKSNYEPLGKHIQLVDYRNSEEVTSTVLGISIDKEFMPSVANVIGTDLSRYKLISKGLFACNPMHVGRDERLPIALYEKGSPAIVSPAYFMFEIIDRDVLNEEYLMMWFRRPEFDRECWFMTDGSVRGGITWDDLCRIKLPIPSYARQCEIVESYRAITDRIALKRAENDNLLASMEAILDKYYTDAFGDTKLSQISEFPIPDDWKIYQLSDLAECQSGYAFYKDGYNDDGIRIVDLGNINRNAEFIQAKTDKYILPERVSAQKYDKFRLYKNDLVMVMTDRKSTMELLGKTGRIYTKEPLLLNQRVYRIRTNSLTSYLYVYLNSERVHIFHKSRALGTAQKYVNNGDINIIPIVLPPKQILEKLLKLFDNSWTIMEHNLNEMNALSVLQDQITLMLSSH